MHAQVFFIRDGMKFPDMVHALKPNPKNHIQEGWRIADFFSHIPEAMHMVRSLSVDLSEWSLHCMTCMRPLDMVGSLMPHLQQGCEPTAAR